LGDASPRLAQEILKHPVKRLVMTELDPALIRFRQKLYARPFVSDKHRMAGLVDPALLSDERISVQAADARRWLQTTNQRFDAVLIMVNSPRTLLLNRYYTSDFFHELRRALRPGGVVSVALPGMGNYPSQTLSHLVAVVQQSLLNVFRWSQLLPLKQTVLLASNALSSEDLTANDVVVALRRRGIHNLRFNADEIPYEFTDERWQLLRDQVEAARQSVGLNRDLRPTGLMAALLYWADYAPGDGLRALRWVSQMPALIYMGIALLGCLFVVAIVRAGGVNDAAVIGAVGCAGFSEMAFEILLILGFQSSFGYTYQWMAFLIAAMMMGLACGSVILIQWRKSCVALHQHWHAVQLGLIVYPVLLGILLYASTHGLQGAITSYAYILMAFVAGVLGGWQFALAAQSLSRFSAGSLLTADLMGGAIGAILVGVVWLPVWGAYQIGVGLVFVNVIGYVGLLARRQTD
jgi:spermidine synthase